MISATSSGSTRCALSSAGAATRSSANPRRFHGHKIPAAQTLAYRIDHRLVLIIDDQRMHTRVVDDELQLRAGQAEIQRHEHRSGRRRGVERFQE